MAEDSIIQILSPSQIQARLKRMAFEIYERNYQAKDLYVMGIDERGGFLSVELIKHLQKISPIQIHPVSVHLDRESDPNSLGIELDADIDELKNNPIVVVDDVLYTGRTLLHVLAILLQAGPSSIQTAVLIDRGHRLLPVSSDYVGIELATTMHQHVSVEIDTNQHTAEAFLL